MTKVAASILSADFANLHKDCTRLLEAGADVMHFDVMDGHFVPNISYGAPVLTCLHAALPDVFYDVHLMISDPARYAAIRAERTRLGCNTLIEVDGGINTVTGPQCIEAGVDWLVAGNSLFRAEDPAAVVRVLHSK